MEVDDNATAITAAPDGMGWAVSAPRCDRPPRPRVTAWMDRSSSIDAPLSSGVISWLGVRRLATSG